MVDARGAEETRWENEKKKSQGMCHFVLVFIVVARRSSSAPHRTVPHRALFYFISSVCVCVHIEFPTALAAADSKI